MIRLHFLNHHVSKTNIVLLRQSVNDEKEKKVCLKTSVLRGEEEAEPEHVNLRTGPQEQSPSKE